MKRGLADWDEFFKLDAQLRGYLCDYYVEPDDAAKIKTAANAEAMRAAFLIEWQEAYAEQLKDEPDEPPDWTPEGAIEQDSSAMLALFNSILAILYRADWSVEALRALFGDWIPVGVAKPSTGSIQIMAEPFFGNEIYTLEADELDQWKNGLVVYDGDPILFWRPAACNLPPVCEKLHVNYDSAPEMCDDLWTEQGVKKCIRR